MEDFQLSSTAEPGTKAVLITVLPKRKSEEESEDPLAELERLAETALIEVVGRLSQRLMKPDGTTHLGKGKVEELKALLEATGAKHVICDQDLSPSQVKNLEEATEARVIDRTELILDIFSQHAQSHQSRLQVELARLEYMLPRLKRMWTHFHRVRGGVGVRGGEGEKQIELDRRIISQRIEDIQVELKSIRERRQRLVQSRQIFSVAIVGYTNAGKSSLFNRLADGSADVADQLFKTLDTRTRTWTLPHRQKVALSDTVGFIRDLPHHLVESFHATLEETIQADLILHVVDGNSSEAPMMRRAVDDVLKQLGADHVRQVMVYNKCDLVDESRRLVLAAGAGAEAHVFVSAKSGEGIAALELLVLGILRENKRLVRIRLSTTDGKHLAWLKSRGEIVAESLDGETMEITTWLALDDLGRLRQGAPAAKIEELEVAPAREIA